MGTQTRTSPGRDTRDNKSLFHVDIALDGTEHSKVVVENLSMYLDPAGVSAEFLYVIPGPHSDRQFAAFDEEAQREHVKVMNTHFDEYTEILSRQQFLVSNRHFLQCHDHIEEGICDHTRRNKPDLLILGMQPGKEGRREKGWHISSTSYATANHVESSVLIIKEPPKNKTTLKVLFATDGSEHAGRALLDMERFLPKETTDITLLNVVPINYYVLPVVEPYVNYGPLEKALKGDAARLLEGTKKSLTDKGFNVSHTYFVLGDPIEQILSESAEGGFDLIVVGSHGLGGRISQWLLGSVSSRVLKYSTNSVAILK